MAKHDGPGGGSWLMAEEYFERGDDAFVDELRGVHDADRLGAFAAKWLADPRPASRRLLLRYLEQPFNAFRHEALLKRLFKLAEQAGDDEVLARFLVGFDRSIRRVRKRRTQVDWSTGERWVSETIVTPRRSRLPVDKKQFSYRDSRTGQRLAAPTAEQHAALRLFSPKTRKYLRRRAWRYLRTLGTTQPDRFVAAATEALLQYTDADTPDGLALIDNWGLTHLLFHDSPVLRAGGAGWQLSPGRTLAELTPAPACESAWRRSAPALIKLLLQSACRPVRCWALLLLRRDHAAALAAIPLRDLLALLAHDDPEMALFAADALAASPELSGLAADDWLRLLATSSPQALESLSDLAARRLNPRSLSLQQVVALACSRPLPVARLGFEWLRQRTPVGADEWRLVARVAHAESAMLRPEMVRWLRTALDASAPFPTDLLLELLDSRHQDVRHEACAWFQEEPRAHQDVTLWQRLLESPYDDIRLEIVRLLERRAGEGTLSLADRGRLDPEMLRLLWASVLLNTRRGGRTKPHVVEQISARLRRRPEEAAELLPILGVAMRSVRGPEFRSGLAAIVGLVERRPEIAAEVRRRFPELKMGPDTTVETPSGAARD